MNPVRVNIDGREVTALPGQTILQVAQENGIEIPTLCHSGDLEVYGSCGICLVEILGAPKLFRACGTAIADGMVIATKSKRIIEARRLALELILSDHRGDCSAPCLNACPVNCDAQGYTALIADGKFKEALALIMEFVPFASTIGRICPALCEDSCRRELVDEPISIRSIKRLMGDLNLEREDPYVPPVGPETGKKIAVVGGGPAGLTAAYFLRRRGHQVSLYEALPHLGGMLRYGIPEYRLPNAILDKEIQQVLDLGITARVDYALGEDFTIENLKERGFDAIYLAIGAQSSKTMGVEGEEIPGVLGGAEFLRDFNIGADVTLGQKVMVVGGGNTAMDAARTARRLGSEVMVVYRRAREQMPAQAIEVEEAEEEGVQFYLLSNPVKIEGNGKVERVTCQRMRLGKADASGRARPEPIPGDFFTLEVDNIIAAIGQDVVTEVLDRDINRSRWNTIEVDEGTFITNRPGVFAGGDAVTGPAIAIDAVAAGKRAAEVISHYLRGSLAPYQTYYDSVIEDLTQEDFAARKKEQRAVMPVRSPEERIGDFLEVEQGLSEEDAMKDASRCLECGCLDRLECKLRDYATEHGIVESRITGEEHDYEEEETYHPFILRDRNKCILCGLCVRTCSEIIGASAIGFVNRGFSTYVSSPLDLPLLESTCLSCGQCVYVCPTGALMERIPFSKPAPFECKETETICSFCGVGCSLKLESIGDRIARSIPLEGPVNKGYLCKKGRFAFSYVNDERRLLTPLIRKDGHLVEGTWEEAIETIAKNMKTIKERSGGDSLALFAGPNYTNEELYLIQKMGRSLLGSMHLNSLTEGESPAASILGLGASTASYDELQTSDFILAVGVSTEEHPIACHHIINAARKNKNLWVMDSRDEGLHKEASVSLELKEETKTHLLKALLLIAFDKDLVDREFVAEYVEDIESIEEELKGVELEALLTGSGVKASELIALVESYAKAKNPILVINTGRTTKEAQALLLDLAALLGALGSPRKGAIFLKETANSQGLMDMGFSSNTLPGYQDFSPQVLDAFSSHWDAPYLPREKGMSAQEALSAIEEKKIKGVMVFGENPSSSTLSTLAKADFLVVSDYFLTDLAKEAHVVLPMATFAEINGSFTNSERRVQRVRGAIEPLTGYTNLEALQKLMNAMGYGKEKTPEEVWSEMRLLIPILSPLPYSSLDQSPYWLNRPGLTMEDLGVIKPYLPKESAAIFKAEEKGHSLKEWLHGFWKEKGLL